MFNSSLFDNDNKSYILENGNDSINNSFLDIIQENNSSLPNNNNNESLDEDIYFIKKDNPSVPINKIKLNNSETNEEKSTNAKTNKENIPEFFSKDKIVNKLLYDEIKTKFMNSNIDKSDEYYYLEKKRKKRKEDDENDDIIIKKEDEKSKRGRKTNSISMNVHNRMVPDNIIKKIKAKIFKYLLFFMNNLLKKGTNNRHITFLNLDYKKYINKLNISFEKELLSMKLKDLLSLDLSSKYKDENKDNNKDILKIIENKGEGIINKDIADTLKAILDITFRDWLDLFTGKKQIKELYDVNELSIKFDMIEKSFVGINGVLNNFKKEDEKYFASFVLFFFNYERWFLIKTPRGVKNKMNEI